MDSCWANSADEYGASHFVYIVHVVNIEERSTLQTPVPLLKHLRQSFYSLYGGYEFRAIHAITKPFLSLSLCLSRVNSDSNVAVRKEATSCCKYWFWSCIWSIWIPKFQLRVSSHKKTERPGLTSARIFCKIVQTTQPATYQNIEAVTITEFCFIYVSSRCCNICKSPLACPIVFYLQMETFEKKSTFPTFKF